MARGATASTAKTYDHLPLTFEVNEGQAGDAVEFLCRGAGYTFLLKPGEAELRLRGSGSRPDTANVRMQVLGGNSHPRVVGLEPQITKSNYFLGDDPKQWHTDIAHYGKVRVESVYPGIDLVYHGNQRELEYDLIVAPHADPDRIRLTFRGASRITLGNDGELIVHTKEGVLVHRAPLLYQETNGGRTAVSGHYVLFRDGNQTRVGFAVGKYDKNRSLVIDPVLQYSTFLGGSGYDSAASIAVDAVGNAYIAGQTESSTFPGVNGSSLQPTHATDRSDLFVTKINAAGTAIIYSTFLGGSDFDADGRIAIDAAGSVYITGVTSSSNWPGTSGSPIQPSFQGGYYDAFVTKLNAAGNAIVYSTYLGGDQFDAGNGIAVDAAGNAYVAGQTLSSSFTGVTAGSLQPKGNGGFVTKINPTGTAIVYSTYLGTVSSYTDYASAIAVDAIGNAYVTGATTSDMFPGVQSSTIQSASGGGQDAFVTKINPAGTAIVYSTYLGGYGADHGTGIAVDLSGSVTVLGETSSPNFTGVTSASIQPALAGRFGWLDAFVTKINPSGTAIVYSTYLGNGQDNRSNGVAVDAAGNAYITGGAVGTTWPGVTSNSLQPTIAGGDINAYVTKINPTGTQMVYSTFLGGNLGSWGLGIAVDATGHAYVTGATISTTFPGVTAASIQPTNKGNGDAFVTKFSNSTLTTQASSMTVGGTISDAATLAGGPISPAGTITFRLYGPNDATCASTPVFTTTRVVAGNGTYASASYTPTLAGMYRWVASYGGDADNDPAQTSCSDVFESVVVTFSDLGVTQVPSAPQGYVAGRNVTFQLTVTNYGLPNASSALLTDVLPANSTLVSAIPSQGSCSGTTTVTCSLGSLNNGATATVAVTVTLGGFGNQNNTATVFLAPPFVDPNPANDTSTVTFATITAIPTLSEWLLILLAMSLAITALKLTSND